MPIKTSLSVLLIIVFVGYCQPVYAADSDNDSFDDAIDIDDDGDGLIEISTLVELNNIRNNLSGTSYNDGSGDDTTGCGNGTTVTSCNGYELINDLNFDTNSDGVMDTNDIYWNSGSGWQPIGSSSDGFSSIFEGNDFTIYNLFINRSTTSFIGFFAALDGATIQNISLSGDLMSITGSYYVGGFAGLDITRNGTQISNCYVGGVISGESILGSILAYSEFVTITNCESDATITSITNSEKVGGLLGEAFAVDLSYSVFNGSASGGNYIGGLIGMMNEGSVTNSYSTGAVSGVYHVGGLFGISGGVIVDQSFSTGNVSGDLNVGGLVGVDYNDSSFSNSYAAGSVTGGQYVAGLIGRANSNANLTNIYASGLVSGSDSGGLIGYVSSSKTVTSSSAYWDGSSTGQSTSAADVGTSHTTEDLQCSTSPTDDSCNIIYGSFSNSVWDFGTSSQYPVLIINSNVYRDADNDGYWAFEDAFDDDALEYLDSDSDGVGDNSDAFPNDATETSDSDNDGIGDNADAFPNDASETTDTDADGIGDNSDLDDDGDGLSDLDEAIYGLDSLDANDVYLDTDGDGMLNLDEIHAGSDLNDATDFISVLNSTFNNGIDAYYNLSDGNDNEINVQGLLAEGNQVLINGFYEDLGLGDTFGFITRVNSDANLDTNFADQGIYYGSNDGLGSYLKAVTAMNNGGYLAALTYHDEGAIFAALTENGAYDSTVFSNQSTPGVFVTQGARYYTPYVYENTTNELYIASSEVGTNGIAYIEKLDSEGLVDSSYASSGLYTIDYSSGSGTEKITAIFEQNSENLLIVFTANNLLRFTEISTDGVLNTDFANAGWLEPALNSNQYNDVIQLNDGRYAILFDGTFNSIDGLHIVVYSSDGVIDTSFGDNAYFSFSDNLITFTALNLFEQSDGALIIASTFNVDDSGLEGTQLVQVSSVGTLDTNFNTTGYSRVSHLDDIDFKYAVKLENHHIVFGGIDNVSNYKAVLRMMNNVYDTDADIDDEDDVPVVSSTISSNDSSGGGSFGFGMIGLFLILFSRRFFCEQQIEVLPTEM